jgi:D-alanyl-lipoteichoic acid acyltransferase DltB (MBOAT superfamily)
MIFTSYEYVLFLVAIFILYWAISHKAIRNGILLLGSYIFYGFVHPWFCLLLASSTIVDYFAGLGMKKYPDRKKQLLILSLVWNLGMLAVFKYFNFFIDSFLSLFSSLGITLHPVSMQVILPVGISFYTFQTLSYTIDIFKGETHPRKNFIDFALFVAFFPQLVAGPIERAKRFLPQIEQNRNWNWERFYDAWPLIVTGFMKKMLIADNVAIFADQVYMLDSPSMFLLFAGTVAFAVQILADFSGYTDIARGTAKLLGFDLVINFKAPYLAISPSDFWRRWHISFSSWIRDYLYIPLGGSRVKSRIKFAFIVVTTMGLSGLWHGAAWHYVLWGVYHGLIVITYHALGRGGRWAPVGTLKTVFAWSIMSFLTLAGWMLFRTSSMEWLINTFSNLTWGVTGDSWLAGIAILGLVTAYTAPLLLLALMNRFLPKATFLHAAFYGFLLVLILILARDSARDFIYFQF